LHPALQQSSQLLLILLGDSDFQRWTTHTPEYGPKQFCTKMVCQNLFRRSQT
jgi:hypothetical protein